MNDFKIRFVPLGGLTNVTKNMYVYELYEENKLKDILIVDCGIGFPLEKELGVDFVIPDISYLKDKTDKIRAVLLTHGHEDHTSALPYHYDNLGKPPIYATKLTAVFVENKFREVSRPVSVNQIQYAKEYSFGDFRVKFLTMTHSIPDTSHILINTPIGSFYHGPDFKLDLTPPYGSPPDFYEIVKAGHDGLLCLLSDCLGAEREGLTLSESIVGQTFEDEMRKTKGKFIMTTFSSNISRIRQCVEAAIKFNRKIIFLGRSMRENTKLAASIGYLPIPESLFAKEDDALRLPPNKVCLIVAGSQGQYGSALSKLASNLNERIRIKPGDKVVFSSDPIPGNEPEVYAVIEDLSLRGADVIYSDIQDQLHASGHGNKEDIKFLIRFTNPKFFIPIGGTIRHQLQYEKIVEELGFDKKSVHRLTEGQTVWFEKNKSYPGNPIEIKHIFVDAQGVGDVGQVVLKERKTLSQEGMVVAVLIIDEHNRLVSKPTIRTKGFIFEKREDELLSRAVKLVEKIMKTKLDGPYNPEGLKNEIIKLLNEFFYKEKGRRPLVLAEVITV